MTAFPQGPVDAQGRQVEPVRYRAEPRERACPARRHHRDLGGPLRDVQLRAGVVVDTEPVRRQRRPRHQGPLVRPLDQAGVVNCGGRRAAEARRHTACRGRNRGRQQPARIREHGAAVEAIRRPSHHGQQVGALRRLRDPCARGRRRRREPHPRQVERRQGRQPLRPRQPRHAARVHHHDAGCEPEDEQGAQRNPDVAVRPDQPAVEGGHCSRNVVRTLANGRCVRTARSASPSRSAARPAAPGWHR